MVNTSQIYSIIVPAQNANTIAHTYTEIEGGTAGCTININGVTIEMGPSSIINLWVRSVSGGTGCFLLGENKDVYQGSTSLDNTPTTPSTPDTCWILTSGSWDDSCPWDDSSVWVD